MTGITNAREYLCRVVSTALNGGECPNLPQNINMNSVVKLAYRNAVQVILYLSFKDKPEIFSEDIYKKLEESYKAAVMREAAQQSELLFIKKAFNENGIDFMLQKGSLLKKLYPEPEMRFMADIDILVRLKDVKKAEQIILDRGFSRKMNNGKDLVLLKEPFLNIELHNALFVEEDSMHEYFTEVWQRAVYKNNHEYSMTDNDLYVYVMAHLTEHFKTGGSCFRPTMDIYLLNKHKKESLDFEYINKQFEILGIADFAKNIKKISEHWFDNGIADDELELTEKYIVLGAPVENAGVIAEKRTSKKSKLATLFYYAFPPISYMKKLYEILEKHPVLLPFCWIARFFEGGKRAKSKIDALKSVNNESISKMAEIMKNSGIEESDNKK